MRIACSLSPHCRRRRNGEVAEVKVWSDAGLSDEVASCMADMRARPIRFTERQQVDAPVKVVQPGRWLLARIVIVTGSTRPPVDSVHPNGNGVRARAKWRNVRKTGTTRSRTSSMGHWTKRVRRVEQRHELCVRQAPLPLRQRNRHALQRRFGSQPDGRLRGRSCHHVYVPRWAIGLPAKTNARRTGSVASSSIEARAHGGGPP
jgi:hypothetical protein